MASNNCGEPWHADRQMARIAPNELARPMRGGVYKLYLHPGDPDDTKPRQPKLFQRVPPACVIEPTTSKPGSRPRHTHTGCA